jgi:Xaa-Pro aminopeptidase
MVLSGVSGEPPYSLFVRPRDPDREIWTGVRGGVEAAVAEDGADAAYPVAELEQRLPAMLAAGRRLYARIRSGRQEIDELVIRAFAAGRHSRPKQGRGPDTLTDPGAILDGMRLIKDEAEIAALRAAARITIEAFTEAARGIRPGAGEWQLEAALDAGFRTRGASGPSFPTIVASGPNATVLHHVANDRVLGDGEAVLLDAGARYAMYCADVTRTFPVGGRFDEPRRTLYGIVLAAHGAAIRAARPGATIASVHDAAQCALEEGLAGLGLVDATDAAERAARVKGFYPHRTSHWLGLDVHDVGEYVTGDAPRTLEPGMVFTVEPGLYVSRNCETAPASMRGIGIRIEDDVLITPSGNEVLTAALPADLESVEDLAG